MNPADIKRLYDHVWWADRLALLALEEATDPPARAVELYAHVVGAELVWLDRIERAPQTVAVWPEADVAGCRAMADRARERYEAFLATVTAVTLQERIQYRNSAGQEFDTPLQDILIHVALHGAYHRGQVALLLRDAGQEPNPTDYIGWARGVPAARRTSR